MRILKGKFVVDVTGLVVWVLVHLVHGSVLSRQALSPFLASRCYNVYGQVQLQLRCPFGHGVRTLLAFTAVSRHDACSYEPWDCIVRPISSHRCEGRTTCFISDRITEENEAQWGHLVCGQGTTPYMHIEYECILLTDFEPGNLTRANDALNYLTRMVIEKQNKYERDDISRVHLPTKTADYEEGESTAYEEETITHIDIAQAPTEGRQVAFFDNKLIFSSIIGGSICGVTIVIASLALLIRRIKSRTYEDSPFYGPPRRHRRSSHSSASDISYMLKDYPLQSRNFLAFLQQQRAQQRAQHLGRDTVVSSSYT